MAILPRLALPFSQSFFLAQQCGLHRLPRLRDPGKDKNGLAAGPRFRQVMYVEGGVYPDVFAYKINLSRNLAEAARLMDEHLLRWVPQFARRVAERCRTRFLTALALLTDAYCEELRDLLAQILAEPRPTSAEIEQRMKPARGPKLAPSTFVPGQGPTW